MIVPDLNLLIYAIDSSSPFHTRSRRWWEDALNGDEAIGFTHPVLFGFVRLTTSARVFSRPLSLAQARSYLEQWTAARCARQLFEDSRHSVRVYELLQAAGAAGGNLVTDAQIAALAMTNDGCVYTADRDFSRFTGLNVCYPLD